MNALQLLTATKERLLTKGWTQDKMGDENGPNCLTGAMCYADADCFEDSGINNALEAIRSAIGKVSSLTVWNDSPERVFEDIIDVLDLAIESLER